MTERTRLSGPYRIVDHDHLRRKLAETADPRQPFYLALESHSTYEAYLAAVGGKFVPRPGYKNGPTNGRDEILYWRRNGWIRDGR